MRVFLVGLILALALQLCIAQQTTPAGLQSLVPNILVWGSSWRLPNVSSVSSWDVSGHTLSTAGSAPTLLANKFNTNNPVPGVNFSGSQCLTSTAISAPSSAAYSVYVVAQLPGVGVHVLAAQEQSTSVGYALILTLNGTTIELGFYADGALVGSIVAESGNYIQGDAMIFWYTQDASYGTIGFDTMYNSFASATASFTAAVTTAVGCNLNGDHFTGVLGEVLILKSGGNNSAAHNIILNSLASRFEVSGIPNVIYTGSSEQNSNCDLDVSGIGAEATGSVLSGNSVQLTLTRQSALSAGSYIMFGRPSDDGDLFALPFNTNYTMFSRSWFVTIAVQGQATADVSFDVSSVKDVMSANNGSYLLLYQSPSASGSHDIIAENGVVSGDNNTVTFAGVTLTTGFITVGSTASIPQAPKAPQAPTSGPVAGPAAGPASPTPYAYPSPGIVRRSDATASTISVVSAFALAASLMF